MPSLVSVDATVWTRGNFEDDSEDILKKLRFEIIVGHTVNSKTNHVFN
jgi:hypothetical protein